MSSNLIPLIRLLSDGAFHSGESIATLIGISRTAVWKKIKKCTELGVEIESVKGKGYRMVRPFEVLEPDKVRASLSAEAEKLFSQIDFFGQLDSSNQHTLNYIDQNGAMPYVCFAEYQTAGRGRRGRNWHSPLGNIAFSVAWSFDSGASALEGLSLVVGLAVVRALQAEGVDGVKLKWPNDVLVNHQKLAGILLEIKGDPQGLCHVVMGVGINMTLPKQVEAIDQPFTSLYEINPKLSRNRLCAQLLNELAVIMPEFSRDGFPPFKDQWMQYDAFINQQVRLISGEREQLGIAKGVSENGALLLQEGGQTKEVYAGEVSLRLNHDT